MGGMDRRSFLFGVFRDHADPETTNAGVKPGAAAGVAGTPGRSPTAPGLTAPEAVMKIGRWRDFPIGESRILGPQGILIESLPEGLRARSGDSGGNCFGITADMFGELAVDPSEIWDEGMVYSIMVAGPVRLESPLEENNERR